MPDVVVTVPKSFGIENWIREGTDLPGNEWSGKEWYFYLGGAVPDIKPGERVYVVYNGKLRGYAPLVRIEYSGRGYALVRHNGAVAVTIDAPIRGFQGFRYRHWEYEDEKPFPGWMIP